MLNNIMTTSSVYLQCIQRCGDAIAELTGYSFDVRRTFQHQKAFIHTYFGSWHLSLAKTVWISTNISLALPIAIVLIISILCKQSGAK
jgi:hypothetical protein